MKNILKDYNYSNLINPEYGEDSVREEIICPILYELGYKSATNFDIVRSRKLVHPYVSFGTQKKKINIIPDYLLMVNNNSFWILEAKAPSISIEDPEVIAQAYSYAIHPEVRAKYFALCNGKEFALYSTDKYIPILSFSIFELNYAFENLLKYLSPTNFEREPTQKLAKDFGLHLKRLNLEEHSFTFFDLPVTFIARIENDKYTISTGIKFDEDYCISIDFNKEALHKIASQLPEKAIHVLTTPWKNELIKLGFSPLSIHIAITCKISDKFEENEDEIFLPLVIVDSAKKSE